MTSANLLTRLRSHYNRAEEEEAAVLSVQNAAILSVIYTIIYVLPFYLSPKTRPSPTLTRDAPAVIQARIRAVTGACILCTCITLFLLNNSSSNIGILESLRLLGWWPIGIVEIGQSLLLTFILFAGPIFEKGVVEGGWRDWLRVQNTISILRDWIGYRNFIMGPLTEEVLFRSLIVSLHLLSPLGSQPKRLILLPPLYFGIAHIHHFYEFTLTHPRTPKLVGFLRSVFQFGFTTVFGWYATFLFVRTGSLWAVIFVHAFCNWAGLPRLWGPVEAPVYVVRHIQHQHRDAGDGDEMHFSDDTLGLGWTAAYYLILVAGAVGFYYALWPLSLSPRSLKVF